MDTAKALGDERFRHQEAEPGSETNMNSGDRLHIAIVCPACGTPGSVASVAIHQARHLSPYFNVSLVSDSIPEGNLGDVTGLRVHPRRFDYLRRFCHVPNEVAFANAVHSQLAQLHETNPINLVICHGHALATLAAGPMKRKLGIPYALVTHGDIFERPKGTYDRRLTWFYRKVTPTAYRNADLVFALSPNMAQRAIRGGTNPRAVHVVPNGIDSTDIGLTEGSGEKLRSSGDIERPLRLLFVGRLDINKGVDILIVACQILKARGLNFSLDIIGVGPMESDLQKQAATAGLNGSVRFLGRMCRHKLGEHYTSSDVVCVPSLSDTLPTVVLEALAAGTPVIGSDVGGIPFMVEDQTNGLVVPPSDPDALASAIAGLCNDRERLVVLQANARPSVLMRFDWQAIGARLRDLIEMTVARDKMRGE